VIVGEHIHAVANDLRIGVRYGALIDESSLLVRARATDVGLVGVKIALAIDRHVAVSVIVDEKAVFGVVRGANLTRFGGWGAELPEIRLEGALGGHVLRRTEGDIGVLLILGPLKVERILERFADLFPRARINEIRR
jgi:hypothetical protein